MSPVEIIGVFLAGLGLFFTGLTMVSRNLKQAANRRFRILVAQWTRTDLRASLLGAVAGFLIQSTSAITFLISGLVSSGLTTVRRALPVNNWAQASGALLILIAVIDIRLVVLYVVGVAGLAFAFDHHPSRRAFIGFMLGAGLLFLGLGMMREGASPLTDVEGFERFLLLTRNAYWLALVIGFVLTLITQSSVAVSVIAITMTQAGLLSEQETLMLMYGTCLGSSALTWLLSSSLRGTARQLIMFAVLFNVAVAALFVPMFYIEHYFGVPLVLALMRALTPDIGLQMALAFILCNAGITVLLHFWMGPIARALNRFWPPSAEDDESRVEHVNEQSLAYPDTALDLVEKEERRLIRRWPDYLEDLRQRRDGAHRQEAFKRVADEITEYLRDLANQTMNPSTANRLLTIQSRHWLTISLEEHLTAFVAAMRECTMSADTEGLRHSLVEALDTLLLTAIDAEEQRDAEDVALLKRMTTDRGEMAERIRRSYASMESQLDPRAKMELLYIANLFDRMVWSLRHLAESLATSKPEN